MNSKPRLRFKMEWGRGKGIHMSRARVKAVAGVIRKRKCDEWDGRIGSLVKSFNPSAIGCRRPYGPTTLGPLRSCM